MQTKLIEGKNALITGGGRGIGKAVALEFAKNGANVAISARSEDELNITIKEMESYGVKTLSIVADLSTVEGVNGYEKTKLTTILGFCHGMFLKIGTFLKIRPPEDRVND